MKLDMNAAWNDAVAMIKANREVMVIIAGVFFFLPSLAALFLIPVPEMPPPDAGAEVLGKFLVDFYSAYWLPFVLMALAQTAGFLALLALLRNDSKPTVGQAIQTGFVGLLPYIGAQLITGLAAALLFGVLVGVPLAVGLSPIAFFTMLAGVVVLVYAMIKLSLTMPVIAIERDMNPVNVLRRSWALTKGNSLRLFLFYFLFFLAFIIISLIIELFFSLIFGLLGDGTAAFIANGSVAGLTSAAGSLVFAAIMAAVHRQLAGSAAV